MVYGKRHQTGYLQVKHVPSVFWNLDEKERKEIFFVTPGYVLLTQSLWQDALEDL